MEMIGGFFCLQLFFFSSAIALVYHYICAHAGRSIKCSSTVNVV